MKQLIKYTAVCLFLFSHQLSWAQKSETPQAINAAGGYGIINGQMFDFNIGETVLVQTFDIASLLFSQGFLQPYILYIPPVVTDVMADNNVITPNNDGKNDLFVVKGLSNYPGSVLRIVDRAGRLLYSATDYQNNWNGTYNGKPLNEDTYYYIIDLGKGKGVVKGFISIVNDK